MGVFDIQTSVLWDILIMKMKFQVMFLWITISPVLKKHYLLHIHRWIWLSIYIFVPSLLAHSPVQKYQPMTRLEVNSICFAELNIYQTFIVSLTFPRSCIDCVDRLAINTSQREIIEIILWKSVGHIEVTFQDYSTFMFYKLWYICPLWSEFI